jgi:hypothetical protein
MNFAKQGLLLVTAILLTACGGGASTPSSGPTASVGCDPGNATTHDECGTVIIGLTDADGDFLNYTVDVLSIELETANGRVVETLPRATRINFTDYVDLAEIVSARLIPPATYVAGTIRLDYSNAEIFVEANGESKETMVKDLDGNALGQTELKIHLSNRNQLRIVKGRAALLQLDFDLAASHSVDIVPSPAEAVTEQFILAEVLPVDEKDIRVRGPLANVNIDEMTYTIALRPFYDRDGDFGRIQVHVTGETEFEVNEEIYVGAEGLRALSAEGTGTPTVAAGTLSVTERKFTAAMVLAGSSVPGFGKDAVVGNVIERDGNFLTVRGATILPMDRRAHFHDDVIVEIGPDTKVFRDGHRQLDLGTDVISIGQRVTIRGIQGGVPTTDANAPQILFDATQGAVRMHVTRLAGIVNAVTPGQADVELYAIDRRRAAIFDFTGTGMSPEQDADPLNYEVATGNLTLAALAEGKPIIAFGFPNVFGMAPPDFFGRTVIDYTDVRARLGFSWDPAGTTAPFTSIGPDGLLLDIGNEDIGVRHHVKQGPIIIDLTMLDAATTIVPRAAGRTAFYIKTADSLRMYSNFDDFIDDLSSSLDGATTARSMHAVGQYDTATKVFAAAKIGIYLLDP